MDLILLQCKREHHIRYAYLMFFLQFYILSELQKTKKYGTVVNNYSLCFGRDFFILR